MTVSFYIFSALFFAKFPIIKCYMFRGTDGVVLYTVNYSIKKEKHGEFCAVKISFMDLPWKKHSSFIIMEMQGEHKVFP